MALRIPFNKAIWQEYLDGQEVQLPFLSHVQDVTDRVIRVMGGNSGSMRLQGTNTYLVGTGRSRILIDTGQGAPCWIERIVQLLEERQLDISHILLTHWHGDHTGGVPDLVAYRSELASRVYKNQPSCGQNPIQDGQVFHVEGATLRAVFTPGHAVDHMCFLLDEENALFTGDNVLGHGYSVVEDLGTYMKSLAYMADQRCAAGYPAHGAKIEDLPAKMHDYINHKESRINLVFSALARSKTELERLGRAGRAGMTLHEIIRSIYGNLPEDMIDKAPAPFMNQVLWKLAEDRKIGFRFEPGEPTKRRWFVTQRLCKIGA